MGKRRIFVEFDNDCVKINNETFVINERFLGSRLDALYGLLVTHLLDYKFYHDHINDIYHDIPLVKEKINELSKIYPEFHFHVAAWSEDKSYIDVPDNPEIIKQVFLITSDIIETEDNKIIDNKVEDIVENDTEQLYKNLREYLVKLNKKSYALEMKKLTIENEISKMSAESKAIETLLRTVDKYNIK